jgi:hypothetical protein
LVKYPRLRFAPFALVHRLTGHADPGGKRHRLAAVAARGARIHGERTFSCGRREPDDLSATDAQNKCMVMVYKCGVLDSVPTSCAKEKRLWARSPWREYSENCIRRGRPNGSRREQNRPLGDPYPASKWNSGQYRPPRELDLRCRCDAGHGHQAASTWTPGREATPARRCGVSQISRLARRREPGIGVAKSVLTYHGGLRTRGLDFDAGAPKFKADWSGRRWFRVE